MECHVRALTLLGCDMSWSLLGVVVVVLAGLAEDDISWGFDNHRVELRAANFFDLKLRAANFFGMKLRRRFL
jgi:uncharacterized protein YjbI with pentapeptide repeats